MEIFTVIVALVAFGLASAAGAYALYVSQFDTLLFDDVPIVWNNPMVGAGLWLVTAIGSVLGAAAVYLIVINFSGSWVNGVFAAVLSALLRSAASHAWADRLFRRNEENVG